MRELIVRYDESVDKAHIVGETVGEIVRCKDCIHKDADTCPERDNLWFTDDEFCSWGERKGGTE